MVSVPWESELGWASWADGAPAEAAAAGACHRWAMAMDVGGVPGLREQAEVCNVAVVVVAAGRHERGIASPAGLVVGEQRADSAS